MRRRENGSVREGREGALAFLYSLCLWFSAFILERVFSQLFGCDWKMGNQVANLCAKGYVREMGSVAFVFEEYFVIKFGFGPVLF